MEKPKCGGDVNGDVFGTAVGFGLFIGVCRVGVPSLIALAATAADAGEAEADAGDIAVDDRLPVDEGVEEPVEAG